MIYLHRDEESFNYILNILKTALKRILLYIKIIGICITLFILRLKSNSKSGWKFLNESINLLLFKRLKSMVKLYLTRMKLPITLIHFCLQ